MRDIRKRNPWFEPFAVPLWARLCLKIDWYERRVGDRRQHPWRCPRGCGPDGLRVIGSRSIGVRIVKCMECGEMDRRLPDNREDRRTLPWEPAPPESHGIAWTRLFVAVVAVVVAALAASWSLGVVSW